MLSCWNEDPDERPTFRQLQSTLKQLADENEVLNLNIHMPLLIPSSDAELFTSRT